MAGLVVLGVAASSFAHADPVAASATANGSTLPPSPKLYVATSAVMGFEPGGVVMVGGSLEGGQRVHGLLWAHEELIVGTGGQIFGDSADLASARLGLEARGCIPEGWACVAGGVDLAGNYYAWSRKMELLPQDSSHVADALIVPRLALDLGNDRFRFRPSFDVPVSSQGWGLEAKLGLALQW
jgi:hypothetical protein